MDIMSTNPGDPLVNDDNYYSSAPPQLEYQLRIQPTQPPILFKMAGFDILPDNEQRSMNGPVQFSHHPILSLENYIIFQVGPIITKDNHTMETVGSKSNSIAAQQEQVSEPAPVICPHCQKKFKSKIGLQAHELANHTWTCHICRRGFMTEAELRAHKRIHTGFKPYQCLNCDQGHIWKKSLTNHVCTQAKINKANSKKGRDIVTGVSCLAMWRCPFCNSKRFDQKEDCELHALTCTDRDHYKYKVQVSNFTCDFGSYSLQASQGSLIDP